MRGNARSAGLLLALLTLSGCEVVDRVRDRGGNDQATSGGLTLALQVPGMLSPGQEGTVRLSLSNNGAAPPTGVRLVLLVPGWMELAPPQPGDREVTMAASEEEGTRLSYRMDEPPLNPGETQIVEQRVRVPRDIPAAPGNTAWGRQIRARLVGSGGQTLAEVQSEVALDAETLANPIFARRDTANAAPATSSSTAAQRDRLGPVSLGMSAAALKQAAPAARDTSWSQEGMTEEGMLVDVPGGRALAVLAEDSVLRIEVRDDGPRTREGMGVGSTLEQLRGAYGTACAGVGEGFIAVWFPSAPGISWALDIPLVGNLNRYTEDPSLLPGTAKVTRWWLRRGTDSC